MKELVIDIESFSSADLPRCGVFKYVEASDFEVLLFSYSVDGGKVRIVDLASGETLPHEIHDALLDDTITKWAFNAQFERTCLSRHLGVQLSPASWRCDMVWAAYMGLPLSLEGAALVTSAEKQKLSEGRELVRYFSKPCNPTQANGGRTRNLPEHNPEKWERFKAYNVRDVETELAIRKRLHRFPVPDGVWEEYILDQRINDRGIMLDQAFVHQAIACDAISRKTLTDKIQAITRLENPNSVLQMKEWLAQHGLETDSLDKKAVTELLQTAPESLAQVLRLRQSLAKSSVKKYTAMQNAVCADGRARGLIQFYGANRTGRFSGRLIQVQNLPQNHLPDLAEARQLVRDGDFATLEALHDSVPAVLSELIRTAFVPKPGCKFIVADFSAIEARVIAWLAKEHWRNEVFASHGKIYEASASQMFNVPMEEITKGSPLRQKGKQAELACIAEGELVLTDRGLVPIENVTTTHMVWDGGAWVRHDGVVCNGIKEVICYDGLRATKDHIVWAHGQQEPVRFDYAAASGARLLQAGEACEPAESPREGPVRVYDIQNAGQHHRYTVSGKLVHNCGYGGSVGALKAMGALEMGVAEEELQPLVNAWRAANRNIVNLWWEVDRATKTAVKKDKSVTAHGIHFVRQRGMLFIALPSGRRLAYVKPRMGENRFGGEAITYEGVGATKKWERIESYGPKFVENIVQAISRDILCYAMRRLEAAGYQIVMHVHDEVVIEAPMDADVDAVCAIMSETPPWAKGLMLRADGYACPFYQKD